MRSLCTCTLTKTNPLTDNSQPKKDPSGSILSETFMVESVIESTRYRKGCERKVFRDEVRDSLVVNIKSKKMITREDNKMVANVQPL